jgi:hypothetical protein
MQHMKITPTVGRVVWFYPANNQATSGFTPPNEGEPLAAIIARVVDADAGAVHLAVFDGAGVSRSEPYVKLVQEGEKVPADGRYATWMPYQIGQAKKHANEVERADEPKLASADASEATIEREIQAKGLTAPRLSPADLDANIVHTEIVKHVSLTGQVLRWAILTTRNGFAVVGKPSVAVSPANDNAEIGTKVAIDNSRTELWPLMGYALKQALWEKDVSV